jgi:PHD/YefM family antitoxin component YafN of YafNO toxin-antitoxin module
MLFPVSVSGAFVMGSSKVANGIPVEITGKRNAAVLVFESGCRSVQETLYLISVPGTRESIRDGLATPVEECEEEPGR